RRCWTRSPPREPSRVGGGTGRGRAMPTRATTAPPNGPTSSGAAEPARRAPAGPARAPAGKGLCRKELRQRRQSCLSATAWDHRTDRPPWDRVIGQAGSASLAGRAVAVMVELLAAAWGAVGPGLGAVVCVRAG